MKKYTVAQLMDILEKGIETGSCEFNLIAALHCMCEAICDRVKMEED